MFVFFFV
jgi:cold shock CspA family protein